MSSIIPTLHAKDTAVVIRKVLRQAFPKTKFSVTTGRGAGVSSVRIHWVDGPTTKYVDALVGGFEAGHFDGMTDMYEYDGSKALLVEGTPYRPGCRYVFTEREISPALANRCIVQAAAYWGGVAAPLPVAIPAKYGKGYEIADGRGRENARDDVQYDWHTLIHQAAGDRTRFLREQEA